MKFLRQNVITILCCAFLVFLISNISNVSLKLTQIIEKNPTVIKKNKSLYYKDNTFAFVSNASDFVPYSKKDLKNIFYTIVNSHWNDFTFYCPSEYRDCVSDMKEFSQNQDLLTHINNYVHPYNSFSNIKTTLSESGEIYIEVDYLYTEEQIAKIDQRIEEIIKQEINSTDSYYDQIKAFHDYIINNTKYDVSRNELGESIYLSYLAYGPLFEGYATCNGYTDVMAIFLSKLNLPNYKIATTPTENEKITEGHVWNAVYLENEWLHLDLTWDDPVSGNGKDYLQHKYFLVTNEELKKADDGEVEVLEHQFKNSIYLEFSN